MTRILFVCLGNICRSCAAQTVMQSIVDSHQRQADFYIDSAGIIDYHEGEKADARMRSHAYERGYRITHLSRPVRQDDFREFDLIIGMDDSNIRRLNAMAPSNADKSRIHRMTEWSRSYEVDEVPDPYYGGDKGFEHVLDLLEDACQALFESLA